MKEVTVKLMDHEHLLIYNKEVDKFYGFTDRLPDSPWKIHIEGPNDEWFTLINEDTFEVIKLVKEPFKHK